MYKHKIKEKRIISEDVTTYLSISFLTYRILYLKTKAQIGDYGFFFFAQVLSGFFTKGSDALSKFYHQALHSPLFTFICC